MFKFYLKHIVFINLDKFLTILSVAPIIYFCVKISLLTIDII